MRVLIQDCVDLPFELVVSFSLPMMGSHVGCTPMFHSQGKQEGRQGWKTLKSPLLHLQNATKEHVLTWEEDLVNGCHMGDPNLHPWDQHRHLH